MFNTVSFIGTGNMATAIINGISGKKILAYDIDPAKSEKLKNGDITPVYSVKDALCGAECIFLSVKPQNFTDLLNEIKSLDLDISEKLFITIAAGIKISFIENALPGARVIRVMPNAPMMIKKGVAALCRNGKVSDKEFNEICHIFSETSKIAVVDEDKIDAITAITSSSPAYLYLFVKAVCDSADNLGIDSETALPLVLSMIEGSVGMIKHTGKTPDELIRMVTSPGGTTEAAMKVFKDEDFEGIIDRAMTACRDKAEELSNGR